MQQHLSQYLLDYIEKKGFTPKDIKRAQEHIHASYKEHQNSRFFKDPLYITAYAITRMPATYAAVSACLGQVPESFAPESILDLGAGPGTASFAAFYRWPELAKSFLVEQHPIMQEIGKDLFQKASLSTQISYYGQTIEAYSDKTPHDLVILSYVLGELSEDEQLKVVEKAWGLTKGFLLLVVPGTPFDYRYLMPLRRILLNQGAQLVAPCPHMHMCPLELKDDWCHFSARLERTKLHQYAKQASLNYEDEKFSYLLFSKAPVSASDARIIRKPLLKSGHVILDLCTQTDGIKRQTVSKKEKETYRYATKLKWGDKWKVNQEK